MHIASILLFAVVAVLSGHGAMRAIDNENAKSAATWGFAAGIWTANTVAMAIGPTMGGA